MAERSKAAVLKTVEGPALREFESHSLRQIVRHCFALPGSNVIAKAAMRFPYLFL